MGERGGEAARDRMGVMGAERVAPLEVLRGMLKAYEEEAIRRMVARGGAMAVPEEGADFEVEWLLSQVKALLRQIARVTVAEGDGCVVAFASHSTKADYEARSRGERAVDASPMEIPGFTW